MQNNHKIYCKLNINFDIVRENRKSNHTTITRRYMKKITRSFLAALCFAGIAYPLQAAKTAVARPRSEATAQPASSTRGANQNTGFGHESSGPSAVAQPESSTVGPKGNPGFDIVNKSGHPITIRLVNGDEATLPKAVVRPSGFFKKDQNQSAQIDINKPTLLIIWNKEITNPKENIYSVAVGEQGVGTHRFFNNWTINPGPEYIYHFKPGKSIYVTFGKDEKLTPQTGSLKSFKKKTTAGYPLTNILTKDDIIPYGGKISYRGELEG